jgi:small subunit ribosomal protein S20
MRTEIKRFRRLLEEQRSADARNHLSTVYTVIDHTAQKGVIHRRTAARYKSRLTHALNRIVAAASS